ncbi:DEAD/DEAH box helicase [Candidatus Laterigemmans baculatus]|uniref:DEAD/DEAH box helicase n=1 Tax=Candidatus Laterigemmans baculatus TaxID=2770505 RepID=UPI0013DA28CE|nr:DEAD/DEAH box helicase family protein [Candidatus Laterigemmans baculatus]
MVDFKKKLKRQQVSKPTNPVELYETLDRASDKGPLRPVQTHVLSQWHDERRDDRDIIVKLHTGQGKTLIGLLMLQSRLNEGRGPALYLCPNHFLVEQTCIQARQFGVTVTRADHEIPDDFHNGNTVLVTTVQKLFNGLTKFGLGPRSEKVGTILLDDSHACIDTIKQACSIGLASNEHPYQEIVQLFEDDLKHQGAGTFSDIRNGDFEAVLAVPYWSWLDQIDAVTEILSRHNSLNSIKFTWPLIRDMLDRCFCIVSGKSLDIIPHSPPLQLFGSFFNADNRIFMSATVTDDSFLVKGLRLARKTIENPLNYPNEPWCGEKMLLLPSLLDSNLSREKVVAEFAKPATSTRKYGIVGLVPSFKRAELWKESDATVADTDSIAEDVERLRDGDCRKALCIVNRYDGVDLPDDACRILVIDSKPLGMSLHDRYIESCRPDSDVNTQRIARIVEQGLGRSVRGEKDYCAIVLAGADLVQAIRSAAVRKFYSAQTQGQIDIGLEIAELANDEIAAGVEPLVALHGLIRKVLERDVGWKEFYVERMEDVQPAKPDERLLEIYARELASEHKADASRWPEAAKILQDLLDSTDFADQERGWYLQEIARLTYRQSKADSKKLQLSAHTLNRFLFKPEDGATVKRLEANSSKRVEAIASWVSDASDYAELMIRVEGILTDLRFGSDSDRFEAALNALGAALGFSCERPDKEWGEGPDNLWCLRANAYLLIECKNRVSLERDEMAKAESGQINNSIAWFRKHYGDAQLHSRMIFPTTKLGQGVAFNESVMIIRSGELKQLLRNVRRFFQEFWRSDMGDLDSTVIQSWLDLHNLSTESLMQDYCRKPLDERLL